MNPVKASARPSPAELIEIFRKTGVEAGFRLETMGEAAGCPLLAMTKRTPGIHPRIYLSAGSHGDEPAGPATLISLLEQGFFDQRATWFICPLLNPGGLVRGTRENPEGIDLNRDYRGTPKSTEVRAHVRWLEKQPRFDLHLCLHEDWESVGFYLYELNPLNRRSHAENAVSAVAQVCPIEMAEMVDGRPNIRGIMRPIADLLERELWPESLYLYAHHSVLGYTLESPSALGFDQRVAALRTAVDVIVQGVRTDFEKPNATRSQ